MRQVRMGVQPLALLVFKRNFRAALSIGLLAFGWLGFLITGTALAGDSSGSWGGLIYSNWSFGEVPWSIHVVQVVRTGSWYKIESVHNGARALGLAPLTAQLSAVPASVGSPIAAVNGDFYQRDGVYAGAPRGLQVSNGELLSGPSGAPCVWVDVVGEPHATAVSSQFEITWPDGRTTPFGLNSSRSAAGVELYTPAIGTSTHTVGGRELVLEHSSGSRWLPLRLGRTLTARVREVRGTGDTPLKPDVMVLSLGPEAVEQFPTVQAGAELRISTASAPTLPGVKSAIGGGPILLLNGRRQNFAREAGEAYEISSRAERHPRTAVGWNQRNFFLVEVDGRQRDLSVGMTLDELCKFLMLLGCQDAVSLDGGGSATLWCQGRVRNSPCDGYERPIANALIVLGKSMAKDHFKSVSVP